MKSVLFNGYLDLKDDIILLSSSSCLDTADARLDHLLEIQIIYLRYSLLWSCIHFLNLEIEKNT